jgi:hypothetical protein
VCGHKFNRIPLCGILFLHLCCAYRCGVFALVLRVRARTTFAGAGCLCGCDFVRAHADLSGVFFENTVLHEP